MEQRNVKEVKQQMLASTNLETGKSSMDYYSYVQPKVISLVVSNLPKDTEPSTLIRVAGSKNVISSEFSNDSAKMQVRLSEGNSTDAVKFSFARLGYSVEAF